MRPKLPERLWLDAAEPPAGWLRPRDAADAIRRLRARQVKAVTLGAPVAQALAVAQALEQGAFNGSLPRCEVEIRLPEMDERVAVEVAVESARRHWATVPTRPPEVAAKPGPVRTFLRFLAWHLIGFAVVIALFEAWSLAVRHEHAAGVAWVVRQIHELAQPAPPRR